MRFQINCSICNDSVLSENWETIPGTARVCPAGHSLAHERCTEHTATCTQTDCSLDWTSLNLVPHLLENCSACGDRIENLERAWICGNRHGLVHAQCATEHTTCRIEKCAAALQPALNTNSIKNAERVLETETAEASLPQGNDKGIEQDVIQQVLIELDQNKASPAIKADAYYPILTQARKSNYRPGLLYRATFVMPAIALAALLFLFIAGRLIHATAFPIKALPLENLTTFNLDSVHSEIKIARSQQQQNQIVTKMQSFSKDSNAIGFVFSDWLSSKSEDERQKALDVLEFYADNFKTDLSNLNVHTQLQSIYSSSSDKAIKEQCLKLIMETNSEAVSYWIASTPSAGIEEQILRHIFAKAHKDTITDACCSYLLYHAKLNVKTVKLYRRVVSAIVSSNAGMQHLKFFDIPQNGLRHVKAHNFLILAGIFQSKLGYPLSKRMPGMTEFNRLTTQEIARDLPNDWYLLPRAVENFFHYRTADRTSVKPDDYLPLFKDLDKTRQIQLMTRLLKCVDTPNQSNLGLSRFNGLISVISQLDLDTNTILKNPDVQFSSAFCASVVHATKNPAYFIELFKIGQLERGVVDFSQTEVANFIRNQNTYRNGRRYRDITELLKPEHLSAKHKKFGLAIYHSLLLHHSKTIDSPELIHQHLQGLDDCGLKVKSIIPMGHHGTIFRRWSLIDTTIARQDYYRLHQLFKFQINYRRNDKNSGPNYFDWALSAPDTLATPLIASYMDHAWSYNRRSYFNFVKKLARSCLNHPESFTLVKQNQARLSNHYQFLIREMQAMSKRPSEN